MIRKSINSILLIVFLIGSVGYSLSLHYCGSRLMAVTVDSKPESCCGDESGTCCHNETRHYQLKDSYFASTQEFNEQTKQMCCLLLVMDSVSPVHITDITNTGTYFITESPPPVPLDQHLSSLQTYLL